MLFEIRYPKLLLFIISVILVYFLFSGLLYEPLHNLLAILGYLGTFFAGLLYPYSFTSAAGTALLVILAKEQSILLAGIIASLGALISDMLIFLFVKSTFEDEVQKLSKETYIQAISRLMPHPFKEYLLAALASILIASPLPTEIGILLMASLRKITTKKFVMIVYILHVSAIFVILLAGNMM